jgi:hypothetical protein
LTWSEDTFGEAAVPPFTPLIELAEWIGAGVLPYLPPVVRDNAVLVVERRWEVPELPGWELLDALAHSFGALNRLVTEAHRRCGVDFEVFGADDTGVRHHPTDHLEGRFPCMLTTRETRSVPLNLRTGDVYLPTQVTSKKLTNELAADAVRRYGMSDVDASPSPDMSPDAFAFADVLGEAARQILRRDGYLIPTAFFVRGGSIVQVSPMRLDDQQRKFLIWQHIADDVRRIGADGLVFVGESWIREDMGDGVRPSEARDRKEAIHVFAAKSTGEVRSVLVPFLRGRFGMFKFDDAQEMREGAFNFFVPVREAWSQVRGAREAARVVPMAADAAGDMPSGNRPSR